MDFRPADHIETLAVHLPSYDPTDTTGGVSAPIYPASAFTRAEPGAAGEWAYSRRGNPTRAAVERTIAR
ncbi:MAG: PLP-dependent transferase, partial [Chloroflexota bacterium]